jgi:NADPH:quinone reductase-like Zn-dependent oxidoreductase
VRPGQRVLVHAAAGGVGHFAVQLAKHLGAHVIGTASAGKHEWLRSLGADELVDYTTTRFETAVSDVDVVVDLIGDDQDETSTRSIQVLRPGGLLVAVPSGASDDLVGKAAAAGVRASSFLVEPDGHALATIAEIIDTGGVRVEVERTLPLDQAAEAHRLMSGGRTKGKIVLKVTD